MKHLLAIALSASLFGAGCMSSPVLDFEPQTQAPVPSEETTETVAPQAEEATTTIQAPTATEQPAATSPTPATTKPSTIKPTPKPVVKPPSQIVGKVYVTITDTGFQPQTVAVSPGDTVVWTNKGTSNHTVASNGALIYDSGNIPVGTSWSRVFPAAGSYGYHDGAHPALGGTVVVR
ncbi:MAG: hypothetical protein V1745_00855 [Patescibacteria group bacterium]